MSLSPPSLPYPPGCVFFPSSPVCVAHLPPLGVRPRPYKETRLTPGSYGTPKLLRVVGSWANSPISTPGFCLGGDHTGLVYAVTTAIEFCAQLFSRVWKTPFPGSYPPLLALTVFTPPSPRTVDASASVPYIPVQDSPRQFLILWMYVDQLHFFFFYSVGQ